MYFDGQLKIKMVMEWDSYLAVGFLYDIFFRVFGYAQDVIVVFFPLNAVSYFNL
jgi:hypothetical protein